MVSQTYLVERKHSIKIFGLLVKSADNKFAITEIQDENKTLTCIFSYACASYWVNSSCKQNSFGL